MKQMVERVPDGASYAPVSILVDERPDGMHLSYERMMSFLGPYGDQKALQVAAVLDTKIEALMVSASAPK
jgi:hypothetical protein